MDFGIVTRGLTALYLISIMSSFGLQVGRQPPEGKASKRIERRMLVRALVIDLLIVPAVAVGMTRALGTRGDVAIALLLLVASPGGGYGPQLVKLAEGDLSLGLETTLFLAKITVITAPLTAKVILRLHALDLPELRLLLRLFLFQFLPMILTKRWARRNPAQAESWQRATYRFACAIAIVLVVGLAFHGGARGLRLLGEQGWLAVMVVAPASLGLGWLSGGRDERVRRTMAVGANARALSVALLMAAEMSPDRLVPLAVSGVWLAFVAFDCVVASIMGHRARHPQHHGA